MTQTATLEKVRTTPVPGPGRLFEWGVVLTASWVVVGAHIDAWAHNHDKTDETFFTPWHGLLYLGVLATGLFLGIALLVGRTKGTPLYKATLPAGYSLSFAGAVGFGLFGGLDLGWHSVFGVEADTAALFSPVHLGLMVSGALIAGGPWRAARARGDGTASLPVLLSAGMVLSMLWFFAQFGLPHSYPWSAWGESDTEIALGTWPILFATATIVGFLFALMRDFKLRPGSLTVLVAVPGVLSIAIVGPTEIYAMHGALIGGAVLADAVLTFVGRTGRRIRVTAVAVPVVLWSVYFGVVGAFYGLDWVVHVWTGNIVVAGITGYLLSLLVFPDRRRPARVSA